jgi:hypothetical protein
MLLPHPPMHVQLPSIDRGKDMADRIYFKHPTSDKTVPVATGFNWPACLLGFIWAFAKKLWTIALLMLLANLIISLIGLMGWGGDVASLMLSLLFAAFCGYNANRWHRRTLERRGYIAL